MTEQEWLRSTELDRMLIYLSHRADKLARKLRLFAVACCYRIMDYLPGPASPAALEYSERYAEGKLSGEELSEWQSRARVEQNHAQCAVSTLAAASVAEAAGEKAWSAGRKASLQASWCVGEKHGLQQGIMERHFQCDLLREICGNPFRPINTHPNWLAWNDGTVQKIAQAIYEERAFDRMPILADALEEAGCTYVEILNHCRQPGEHVQGCWVIDALLGKS